VAPLVQVALINAKRIDPKSPATLFVTQVAKGPPKVLSDRVIDTIKLDVELGATRKTWVSPFIG
jgi:hypothetical protein